MVLFCCFFVLCTYVPRPLTNDLWVFLFQTTDAECVEWASPTGTYVYVKAYIVNVNKRMKLFFLEQYSNIVNRVTLQSFWFIFTSHWLLVYSVWFLFCYALLSVLSSFAFILTRKRELDLKYSWFHEHSKKKKKQTFFNITKSNALWHVYPKNIPTLILGIGLHLDEAMSFEIDKSKSKMDISF